MAIVFWIHLMISIWYKKLTVQSFRELLRLFTNPELIKWSGLCEAYEKELKFGSHGAVATDVFKTTTEDGQRRWKDLKSRVVEHVWYTF